jgi:pimeloyl-ACP methyl ester carboxylesterase
MQEKEFSYKGKRIVYRTAGEGPVVVLLHGFGEDGTIWKEQYGLFSGYQLLIPDLPGSGQSEAIEDMRIEGLADAVKALIDAEAAPPPPKGGLADAQPGLIQKANSFSAPSPSEVGMLETLPLGSGGAVIIGHSMGGYITLAFAEKYPEGLRGFGLFHSTAFADNEEKKQTRRKGIRFMQEHGAAEFLKTMIPNLYAPPTRDQHPEWIDEHLRATRNFLADSLVSYYEAMIQRPDRTHVLQDSQVPVLFVMGRHDSAVPLPDGLKQGHLPQITYIHILENSGHMGMREEVNKTNEILSQFVNAIEKTA